MAPGVVGGALIPLGVYYAVRSSVGNDAKALMIAGAPAAAWVAFQWFRTRRFDPIGSIVLCGFIAGVIASILLGGNSFVLKVRDSGFTALLGVVSLVSLSWRRPLMFFIGRAFSAGSDPVKIAAYDDLWALPTAPRAFRIITACWGVGLILDAATRVTLAAALPTGPFLAVSPFATGILIGGLFVFTVWFSKRARRLGETKYAELGVVYPSVSVRPPP